MARVKSEFDDRKMTAIGWFIQGLIDAKFRFPVKPDRLIPRIFRKDYHQAQQIVHQQMHMIIRRIN